MNKLIKGLKTTLSAFCGAHFCGVDQRWPQRRDLKWGRVLQAKLLEGKGRHSRRRGFLGKHTRPSWFALWLPLLPDLVSTLHACPLHHPYYCITVLIVHSMYQTVSCLCAFAQTVPSAHWESCPLRCLYLTPLHTIHHQFISVAFCASIAFSWYLQS